MRSISQLCKTGHSWGRSWRRAGEWLRIPYGLGTLWWALATFIPGSSTRQSPSLSASASFSPISIFLGFLIVVSVPGHFLLPLATHNLLCLTSSKLLRERDSQQSRAQTALGEKYNYLTSYPTASRILVTALREAKAQPILSHRPLGPGSLARQRPLTPVSYGGRDSLSIGSHSLILWILGPAVCQGQFL